MHFSHGDKSISFYFEMIVDDHNLNIPARKAYCLYRGLK